MSVKRHFLWPCTSESTTRQIPVVSEWARAKLMRLCWAHQSSTSMYNYSRHLGRHSTGPAWWRGVGWGGRRYRGREAVRSECRLIEIELFVETFNWPVF